jgi:threonine dehydrogenase-like Zn-dependent dehydrogenase
MFATHVGIETHVLGLPDPTTEFARTFPFAGVWTREDLPELRFDAVVDASYGAEIPAFAVDLVEPGKRVVLLGLAGKPSLVDGRSIALRELTVCGLLGASAGLDGTIELFASGLVPAERLVAGTLPLDQVADVLAGDRPARLGRGPKVHFDPALGGSR